jgi:hypothetical protein
LSQAAKELTGKTPSASEAERWRELGEVLSTELKIAAARTSVSSVPSFLAEHLRRRLFKKDQKQIAEEVASSQLPPQVGAHQINTNQVKECPDCGGAASTIPKAMRKV